MSKDDDNTTNEQGNQLDLFVSKALSQQDKVLNFLKCNKDKSFTPFEVHKVLFDENTPVTSTRRSISNLIKLGEVKQTDEKVIEKYNRPNYKYKYNGC